MPGHPEGIRAKESQFATVGDDAADFLFPCQVAQPGESRFVPLGDQSPGADFQGGVGAFESFFLDVLYQGVIPFLLPLPGPLCPRVPGDSRLHKVDFVGGSVDYYQVWFLACDYDIRGDGYSIDSGALQVTVHFQFAWLSGLSHDGVEVR